MIGKTAKLIYKKPQIQMFMEAFQEIEFRRPLARLYFSVPKISHCIALDIMIRVRDRLYSGSSSRPFGLCWDNGLFDGKIDFSGSDEAGKAIVVIKGLMAAKARDPLLDQDIPLGFCLAETSRLLAHQPGWTICAAQVGALGSSLECRGCSLSESWQGG
jgi:hypothetical protein